MNIPHPPHRFLLRVYYEDTDAGGVVYYANYLKFAERARTEWLLQAAPSAYAAFLTAGAFFVVRRCAIDYLAPARLHDALAIETQTIKRGGASVVLSQCVWRGALKLAEMEVVLVAVDAAGRPQRIPPDLAVLFGV